MQPMSGMVSASGTFIGQNWGAKQKQRIRDTLKKILGMETVWGLFSCLIVYLFGRTIIRFVTGTHSEEILNNAVMSLRIHLPFFPVLGVLPAMRVSMQSMRQKTAPVVSGIIELLMKMIAVRWMIPSFGFIGVCVTEPVTWVIMTAFMIIVYLVKTGKNLAVRGEEAGYAETGTDAVKTGSKGTDDKSDDHGDRSF